MAFRFAAALLAEASFNVLQVRSSHTANEKQDAYNRFNDPNSGVDAFVLNLQVSAVGISLHGCCSRGVFLEPALNRATEWQAIGRIWRYGQEKDVEIVYIHTAGTYMDVIADKSNIKYIEQMRNECAMPAYLTHPVLQRVVAGQILSEYLGWGYNLYASHLLGVTCLSDYHSPAMISAGKFLEAMASALWQFVPQESPEELEEMQKTMVEHLKTAAMTYSLDSMIRALLVNAAYKERKRLAEQAGQPFLPPVKPEEMGITMEDIPTVRLPKTLEPVLKEEVDLNNFKLSDIAVIREAGDNYGVNYNKVVFWDSVRVKKEGLQDYFLGVFDPELDEGVDEGTGAQRPGLVRESAEEVSRQQQELVGRVVDGAGDEVISEHEQEDRWQAEMGVAADALGLQGL